MSRPPDIRVIEKRIGYSFHDWRLLSQALTHCSKQNTPDGDNQRLEFLGDRVLGLVVADMLMQDRPYAPPGDLSVRLNALVNRQACAFIAREIKLADAIRVGKSAKSSKHRKDSAIAPDAIEAVIGAIYVESGLEAARRVILRLWSRLPDEYVTESLDAKSRLQIFAQGQGQMPPSYTVVDRKGLDHNPEFLVRVCLQSGETANGSGRSKRLAELGAAASLLKTLSDRID